MAIRLVVADFDGTLADSMLFWRTLPWNTLRDAGIDIPEDMDALICGHTMREISGFFAARYPELGSQPEIFRHWMATMADNYRRRISLKPGAMALLAALKKEDIPVCILSATNHDLLDPAVEQYGMLPYLAGIISEKDTGSTKRTPIPFAYCRERFGVPYEQTLLLEDSLPNTLCARELGLHSCGIYDACMASTWPTLRETADVALDSPEEYPRLMDYIRSVE